MSSKQYFSENRNCQKCTDISKLEFKYIEIKKGEKYSPNTHNTYAIIFFLTGKVLVSCCEFQNKPFHFGQIVLCPINESCEWKALLATTCIVLLGNNKILPYDRETIKDHSELWLDITPEIHPLPIKPRLMEFLQGVRNYLEDGTSCPLLHKIKQQELSLLFRGYYSQNELLPFLLPIVRYSHEFEHFIMDNYLKMKGVKEFVDLSGMTLSAFNRKFKVHFKESPYQWLIKQRAKHIYHELLYSDRTFASIAKEFHFSDASHFNRYCKSMFGNSPSKIRQKFLSSQS